MLTAYFDDSGTHDSSEVVLWSGVLGNEHQWGFFSDLWVRKLRDPSPGKCPLNRFHMTDCQNSDKEFAGWSRTATDFLVHELGQIIIKAGLWSWCSAVSRKDWDELVTEEDLRTAWGDAEKHCIMGCFSKGTQWAQANSYGEMAFVFDDRPHRNAQVKKMFDIYRRFHAAQRAAPALASITFATAARFPPLQAADLLAWEQYQFARSILKNSASTTPQRPQFASLMKHGRIFLRLADRAEIKRMLSSEYANPEKVAEIARDMKLDFSGE
jgi:hypothetical protein